MTARSVFNPYFTSYMMRDLKGGEENRINRTDSSIIRLILQMVYSQSQIYFILLEIFFFFFGVCYWRITAGILFVLLFNLLHRPQV